MPPLMSYRIVILNGDKRGQRLDIGRAPLSIGTAAFCDIQLADPLIGEVHATLSPLAGGLQIVSGGEAYRLLINKHDVQSASLKNGDVIEIGTTRLFVQAQSHRGKWGRTTRLHKWKKWLTVGLPILILVGIALSLRQCRSESSPLPGTIPLPRSNYNSSSNDAHNTDWTVTNIPHIIIDSQIVMSAIPPEVAEALELFAQSRSNNIQEEVEAALKELEFASNFLAEARAQDALPHALPDPASAAPLLQQAAESLLSPASIPAPL